MRDNDSATALDPIALLLAFGGVLSFSFTFPATVFALEGLDPYLIGIGRAAFVAVPAAIALACARARLPREPRGLLLAGLGTIVGFPVLSSVALGLGASASHSAVVIGLLPAATAVAAVLFAGERPAPGFWRAALAGAACVTVFTLWQGGGSFAPADLLLVGALLLGAVGYAEGARLARSRPAWQVVCWALVLYTPLTVPVTAYLLATTSPEWTPRALGGFAYVSLFSMFLGFFAWYAGLARAGIAKAGQIQLLQPLLTLGWAALFLDDPFDPLTAVAALAVLGCVAWTQRASRAPRTVTPRGPSRSRTWGRVPRSGNLEGYRQPLA
ncbi:drug/metabolite transporter (DMT)-like permease [Actinocorallia herbida]|uniref:Drug/metabolite transporter (DMT)-like permease n=1 Tax=Actinocorallia herbida TaxID=58109 RepID=A0A3N1CQJ7_9ACTN|nr:DMT family transporter [Actinocorallia herbida]ROO83572.1 drug/metabolite transporter (DMT)-like permease [Actinocorallia herbida]